MIARARAGRAPVAEASRPRSAAQNGRPAAKSAAIVVLTVITAAASSVTIPSSRLRVIEADVKLIEPT